MADAATELADTAERGGGLDRLEVGRNPHAAQALKKLGANRRLRSHALSPRPHVARAWFLPLPPGARGG